MKTISAIFEGGVFRPLEKVDLPDKTKVDVVPRRETKRRPLNRKMQRIYAILSERCGSGERDVAARHNEHQP